MRVAVVAGPGRTALLQELAEDGTGYAAPTLVNDLPAAVADYERAGPDRGGTERGEPVPSEAVPGEPVPGEPVPGEPVRWVWADTSTIYPSLLRSGVRVDRCHDIALTEALLRASGGTTLPSVQHPAVAASARPLLTGQAAAVRAGHAVRAEPGIDEAREILSALVGVHADQLRRIAADPYPARFGLLAAVESAGGLSAAEMRARGMPWRADVHDALLEGLLGRRPGPGFRPPRLADLAAQISASVRRPPGQPRFSGSGAEGVRHRGDLGLVHPVRRAARHRPPRGSVVARIQGAGPAACGPRLVLAGRMGARRPVPPGVRGRGSGVGPVGEPRWRCAADSAGGPPRGGRGSRLGARGRGRGPTRAAGARRARRRSRVRGGGRLRRPVPGAGRGVRRGPGQGQGGVAVRHVRRGRWRGLAVAGRAPAAFPPG